MNPIQETRPSPASSPLDRITIASPCQADWNAMQGDDRRRFCASCKLHVHDLSRMTKDEAMALLREAGQGRLCVRLFRRADGTVLTRDCPVGVRQKVRRALARAGALWLALCSGLAACVRPAQGEPQTSPVAPQPRALQGEVEMGDMAAPVDQKPVAPTPPPELGKVRASGN